MNYLDKYKGQGDRRSIYDILSLDPSRDWETIRDNYVAADIEKVVIGGNTFKNYGDFQFAWEKSYVKSPERSANGSIGNLNSYATFATPHLIINFSLMSIDDYRKIMRLDLEQNEFVVECYDPIYNKKFKGNMYFGTPQMAKLFKIAKIRFDGERWEEFVELVGVQEYTVELIGTNNDLDLVSVRYIVNPPEGKIPSVQDGGEEDVYKGEEIIIGASTDIQTETFGGTYKFKHWEDESGLVYTNGYAKTINDNLVLYAQWEPATDHILSYNYGLADPEINDKNYAYVTSKTVVQGQSIGVLPIAETPVVKIPYKNLPNGERPIDPNGGLVEEGEKTYYPYSNPQWWKTPLKVQKYDDNGNDITSTLVVKDNQPYWSNRDAAIYLLYDVQKYPLYLFVGGVLYQQSNVEYNAPISLPILVKEGHKFDGWYMHWDENDRKVADGSKMTPYSLVLEAKWVKN